MSSEARAVIFVVLIVLALLAYGTRGKWLKPW